jgi:hypothetical protein
MIWRIGQYLEGMPTSMRRHVFPWAISRAQERYRLS